MLPKLQPQKEIMVDGVKYVVQLYPPSIGLRLYAKLIRLMGEPLIKFLGSFKGKSLKDLSPDDLDFTQVGETIELLFAKLPEDSFVPLIQEILQSTFTTNPVAPVNDQFESIFMGHYTHVFKLVGKTLGAQYPDFLSGITKRRNVAAVASATNEKKAGGLNSATISSGN